MTRPQPALEHRLAPLRRQALDRPPRGWIKAVRQALGMTSTQLARRLGVSQSRVAKLEKAESEDAVTLRSLREAAEALGCTLVYALVPTRPLDEVLRARAEQVADAQLARTNQTMALEDQALDRKRLIAERERLIDDILRGDARRLWDMP